MDTPKPDPMMQAMQMKAYAEASELNKEQMALIKRQTGMIDEARAKADREEAEQKLYKRMNEGAAVAGRVGARSILSNGWVGFSRDSAVAA